MCLPLLLKALSINVPAPFKALSINVPAPEMYLCYAAIVLIRTLRVRHSSRHMVVLTFLTIGTRTSLLKLKARLLFMTLGLLLSCLCLPRRLRLFLRRAVRTVTLLGLFRLVLVLVFLLLFPRVELRLSDMLKPAFIPIRALFPREKVVAWWFRGIFIT